MHDFVIHPVGDEHAGLRCRLYARSGPGRCGEEIAIVVEAHDRDIHPGRKVRRFGACADHAGYYSHVSHSH